MPQTTRAPAKPPRAVPASAPSSPASTAAASGPATTTGPTPGTSTAAAATIGPNRTPNPAPVPAPALGAGIHEAQGLLAHLEVAADDREVAHRKPLVMQPPHRPLGRRVVGIDRHDARADRDLYLTHRRALRFIA